jgi:tetratricopeptide (TPR) repeat protein
MQIAEKLVDNPSAQTYYEAARYYVEQGVKFETALAYLNKALELGGDTYFFHRVKSLAEAELGDYKAAITSAQKSLELAQEQAKDEFVRMNQKNIDLWKRKP